MNVRRLAGILSFSAIAALPLLSLSQEIPTGEIPPPPPEVTETTPPVDITPPPVATPEPTPEATPTPEPAPEPTPAPTPQAIQPIGFHELSLAIRPGFSDASGAPATIDDSGFMIGGHVTLFLHKWVGLNVPYTYSRFGAGNSFHTIGGGPAFRYVDWGPIRGLIDANFLYARALGANHAGWSMGIDITGGFRKVPLKPFLGPFFRYERIYLPGDAMGTYEFGVTISLTNDTELD